MTFTLFHVSVEQAKELLSGSLSPEERRRVVRHLLTRCGECLALMRDLYSPKGGDEDYAGLLRRLELSYLVSKAELEEERKHASSMWSKLRKQLPEQQLFMVRNTRSYQTWGVYERIIEEVKTVARDEPLKAVDLSHLALEITELLDVETYGRERIADFQSGAYTALGNAKRIVGDLKGAESALRKAEEFLREGTGDPLEGANFISISCSLKADLGYLEDATAQLLQAVRYARRAADRQLEAKLVLQQSSYIGFLDPIEGLKLADKALALLESGVSAHLELVGRHLQAFWTNERGDPEEAAAILETYRYLYADFNDVFWTGRLLHLEGNIARTERDYPRSEFFFRQLVELYSENSFEFDLALAALDLAEVLALQSRLRESSDLLKELYPVLERWELHGDILRSWRILQEGVRKRAEIAGFRKLAMTLRRKWYSRGNREESKSRL